MKGLTFVLLLGALCVPACAQQSYVPRADIFGGFSYLYTPTVSLNQRGFNGEGGINITRWLALGGDFSVFTGNGTVKVSQTVFAPLLAPVLSGADPGVPFDATTYTFAAGPQLNFRHWSAITIFVRPFIGAIHEHAVLKPPLLLAPVLSLVPGLNPDQTDTAPFFGAGGGFDVNASRHVALRFSVDYANTHLFSDLLQERRNNVRFSAGPTFRWGELK